MRSPTSTFSNISLRASADQIVTSLGGHWYGSGALCRCPAHDDHRPSLSIRIGHSHILFKCFAGCQVADIMAALRRLRLAPASRTSESVSTRPKEDGYARVARKLWGRGHAVSGTPAERYLLSRGLAGPHPSVRYLAQTPLGSGAARRLLPAMLIAAEDDTGVVAIHRLFLDADTGAKANIDAPRRTLGRLGGSAVRLAPAGRRLGLAEGYETARAAQIILGIPVWAVLGAERLQAIALPDIVEEVVLLPDNDAAGARAQARASRIYRAQGRSLETRLPPAGMSDWRDVLTRGA